VRPVAVRPRLLCRERYPGPAFADLERRLRVEIAHGPVAALGPDPDVAAVWTVREDVDDRFCDAFPGLRAVAVYGVGIDRIDVECLRRRGIELVVPRGANADAVANHTFALLLAIRNRIVERHDIVRSGGWETAAFREPVGEDVHGSTLGIVGFGAIGRAVARRAEAFGMRVLHHSRSSATAGLDELLAASDAVTLHCPLLPETRGLLDRRRLGLMRPSAVLVNTSRGAVVDEAALIEALESGGIAGAGLDVFADEPHVPERLRALPNVVLTPHVADVTTGTTARMTRACVDGLLAALG
jgi:glyoxylate reductase